MKTTRLIYFSAFLLMSLTSLQAAPLQTVQEKIKDLNTRKVPAAEQITAMEQLLADKEIQADQAAQKNVIATIDNNCNQIFNQMATDFRNNKTSYLEQIKGYNEFQKTFAKYASPLVTNKINYELNRCYENMINEQFDKLYKDKNKSFREIVQILKKILEDHPDLNKHARARFHLYRLIMQSCFPSGWTLIHRFDYTIADTELKPIVDKVLSDPELNAGNRNLAAGMYINYLCGKERFDEAEEFARKMLDQPDMTNADKAQTYVNLSEVYRHRRNFDKAMVYIKEAIKYDAVLGKKAGTNLALKFNKPQMAIAVWEGKDQHQMLQHFDSHGIPKTEYYVQIRRLAAQFVQDRSNPARLRLDIMLRYCLYNDIPEYNAARKTLPALLKELNYNYALDGGFTYRMARNYQLGNYAITAEIGDAFADHGLFGNVKQQNMYIISLGVIGRKAEAAEYARKWAAREKIKPVDAVRFRFYEAILSGKSTDGLMDQSLSRKDQAAVYLSAARQTLTWNMSDLSEKYTKEYKKFFVPFEPRRFVVNYSDTPISGIAAWRKIYPELEKQYCDIPYRGSMEFLETDVSTGNRSVNTEVKTDTVSKNMEMTAVCDRYGLHVFLRCEDENARDIERGFAPGIATEIYFAPGRNQPYICIGGGVATVDFLWQSSYNHKNHTRLIQNQAKPTFRHEAEFTDKDYVLHLFFAWDSYYNKLPENGRNWRFECLAWAPSGGFSWGGSQGIHSASSWGDLEFKLNKKQIAEIKRELIAKTYRNYKQVPKSPGITENLFQCWADDAIGDPVFYDKYLKDLEKELDSYQAMVQKDMSDDEVIRIYDEAYARWKGLSYEIDELRQKYLMERLVLQGK